MFPLYLATILLRLSANKPNIWGAHRSTILKRAHNLLHGKQSLWEPRGNKVSCKSWSYGYFILEYKQADSHVSHIICSQETVNMYSRLLFAHVTRKSVVSRPEDLFVFAVLKVCPTILKLAKIQVIHEQALDRTQLFHVQHWILDCQFLPHFLFK